MKRLILIFLLTVLSLQMSWAVAAAYCQHEQATTVRHLGHHTHQHQTEVDTADDQESQFKIHTDCGYCQGVTQSAIQRLALSAVIASGSIMVASPPFSFSSHIPDGPMRPDRRSVA
jgi:hypothetical protein